MLKYASTAIIASIGLPLGILTAKKKYHTAKVMSAQHAQALDDVSINERVKSLEKEFDVKIEVYLNGDQNAVGVSDDGKYALMFLPGASIHSMEHEFGHLRAMLTRAAEGKSPLRDGTSKPDFPWKSGKLDDEIEAWDYAEKKVGNTPGFSKARYHALSTYKINRWINFLNYAGMVVVAAITTANRFSTKR